MTARTDAERKERMMTTRFRSPQRREAYEWARKHPNTLAKEQSGRANAYRRGYDYPDSFWPRNWTSYPFFAAGRDNRRAIDALPTP